MAGIAIQCTVWNLFASILQDTIEERSEMWAPMPLLLVSIIFGSASLVTFWMLAHIFVKGLGKSREVSEDVIARSITYHNEAIYKDFTFFVKVTLALMGGVGYLVIHPTKSQAIMLQLLIFAALFQFVIGALFSAFIIFHQKSKIERWEKKPSLFSPLVWEECWMVTAMMMISALLTFVFIPAVAG
jgi:hypothetical protein